MTDTRWLGGGMFLGICLVMGPIAAAGPDLSSKVLTEGDRTLAVIANPFVELTFEPARGGRCVRFRFLDNGEQLIGTDATSGMFLDHWSKYPWPSGLMRLPYQYEIVRDDEQRIGLKQSVVVPAMGGGKGDGATSPELVGLVVKKTVWLNAHNDCIVVEHEIENPTTESRGAGLYVQHALSLNGDPYHDIWYLPSSQGVVYSIQPTQAGGKSYGADWVLEPTAGWIGVRDQQTKRGLVFAFDYNYLQKIYTCGSTAEWFLEPVPVAPGKSFKTTHVIKPVSGFEDFAYASKNLVADVRGKAIGNEVEIALNVAAVSHPLGKVTFEATVIGWRSKKALASETFTLDHLGFEKTRQTFRLPVQVITDGVVIRVTAKGTEVQESFERYYAGDKFEHERRYGWFATKGGALAGAQGDAYHLKPPRKVKQFHKPDFARILRPAPDKFKCLVVFGLYTQILDLDDALAGWKDKGGHPVEFTWANCPPNAVETFPGSYDELFSYNLVVLSDVNFRAIGDTGFEMLCDYVEQGGALLVTGGPYAFGNGAFEGSRFLEALPVTLSGAFDLKWAGKGRAWDLKPADARNPLLKGLSFQQQPKVFWRHLVTPKTGAEVVLTAGGKPALVVGKYGQGKVAVFTLSPTGEARRDEMAWWDWDGWPVLMKNVLGWMEQE